jgi:hypothetical protein
VDQFELSRRRGQLEYEQRDGVQLDGLLSGGLAKQWRYGLQLAVRGVDGGLALD